MTVAVLIFRNGAQFPIINVIANKQTKAYGERILDLRVCLAWWAPVCFGNEAVQELHIKHRLLASSRRKVKISSTHHRPSSPLPSTSPMNISPAVQWHIPPYFSPPLLPPTRCRGTSVLCWDNSSLPGGRRGGTRAAHVQLSLVSREGDKRWVWAEDRGIMETSKLITLTNDFLRKWK